MLRFAPRYGMISPCLRRPAGRPAAAANDNAARSLLALAPVSLASSDEATPPSEDEALLVQALQLFASHGHGAADQAASAATRAAERGDHCDMAWWTAVCHTLDRRQARDLRRQLAELA